MTYFWIIRVENDLLFGSGQSPRGGRKGSRETDRGEALNTIKKHALVAIKRVNVCNAGACMFEIAISTGVAYRTLIPSGAIPVRLVVV